ncbi:uncharacterized protein PHACADRAFT_259234 [Phanerochaete carnosa HHB-10118-sp]|uniref:Uncharacterized protein n=1 Tax=Phanerochaete carnosa (strain HHB-10118-sp) TaxID=650164 RepID=K5WRR5_PHACS|nr:uncharacterized protein PHACADRAFT_259234 [Phanerochaete carnosa HHB-10118-sp]EKM53082.1 hypothetical protein PHACADRAFT_259234 [Phanerochaete carnosa HHB-10118-sp]
MPRPERLKRISMQHLAPLSRLRNVGQHGSSPDAAHIEPSYRTQGDQLDGMIFAL